VVAAQHAKSFVTSVTLGYKEAFDIDAASYICEAAAGAVAQNSWRVGDDRA
jgi:hypothetical protein